MHKMNPAHFPEAVHQSVFPFKPSRPSSPQESRLSTPALRRHIDRVSTRTHRPYLLTQHGVEYRQEPGPSLPRSTSLPQMSRGDMTGLDRTRSRHCYRETHEFGHHEVGNNVNPFLAHHRLPKWQTTSEAYGVHYRHPQQTYLRAQKNRMPVFHIQV
mmetsp:Transcript_57916/g.161628  ORF Transcript_57916/g.161628 Transcript_57916/m.161628 type:complete len:157 (-) Transcript_57916:80-550(-)